MNMHLIYMLNVLLPLKKGSYSVFLVRFRGLALDIVAKSPPQSQMVESKTLIYPMY